MSAPPVCGAPHGALRASKRLARRSDDDRQWVMHICMYRQIVTDLYQQTFTGSFSSVTLVFLANTYLPKKHSSKSTEAAQHSHQPELLYLSFKADKHCAFYLRIQQTLADFSNPIVPCRNHQGTSALPYPARGVYFESSR